MLVFHDVMSAHVSGCRDHATCLRISLKYCSAIHFDFRATDQEATDLTVAAQINVTRFVTDLLNQKHVKTYRQSYRLIVKFIVKSETKIIVFRMTNIRATALHRKAPLRTND